MACRTGLLRSLSSARRPVYHHVRSLSSSNEHRASATQKWFESVVIGEKLCPFAPPLLSDPRLLQIIASEAMTTKEAVNDVSNEVERLVSDSSTAAVHETTLVVFDNADFCVDFRDFVRLSWELQEQVVGEKYLSVLQLVLFHPQATHQTYGNDNQTSPADFTIRSPFPTIHLLREEDVLKAVSGGYPNLETLPSRNKEKMIQQGLEVCEKRLRDCYATTTTATKR